MIVRDAHRERCTTTMGTCNIDLYVQPHVAQKDCLKRTDLTRFQVPEANSSRYQQSWPWKQYQMSRAYRPPLWLSDFGLIETNAGLEQKLVFPSARSVATPLSHASVSAFAAKDRESTSGSKVMLVLVGAQGEFPEVAARSIVISTCNKRPRSVKHPFVRHRSDSVALAGAMQYALWKLKGRHCSLVRALQDTYSGAGPSAYSSLLVAE